MKKLRIGLVLGICVLLFALASTAWAQSANESDYEVMPLAEDEAQYIEGNAVVKECSFEEAWNSAIQSGNGQVRLLKDITAVNGSFGSGDGFDATNGHLVVPVSKTVTLDLNGHTIDRKLTASIEGSPIIEVNGILNLIDNSEEESGVITGGFTNQGGAIAIKDSGWLKMSGGTIRENTAVNNGGGVYMGEYSHFTMLGGRIENNYVTRFLNGGGGVSVDYTATFEVAGRVVITNNKSTVPISSNEGKNNLQLWYKQGDDGFLSFGHFTIIGPLEAGSNIGVYISSYLSSGIEVAKASDAAWFTPGTLSSDHNGYYIGFEREQIRIIKGEAPVIPVTHKHNMAVSDKITTAGNDAMVFETFPETGYASIGTSNGTENYYLDKDITIDQSITVNGTVNLCLNGHVITQTKENANVFLIPSGATLSICDCSPGTGHTGLSSVITGLTGGIITGGNLNYTGNNTIVNGAGINNSGTLNLYGGSIANNISYSNEPGSSALFAYGGGIYSTGTFNMYGGAITKNTADASGTDVGAGGGVYNSGQFNMYDGKIANNKAKRWGAGVYNAGTFTLYNGSISANTVSGGVFNGATMTMEQGEISKNTSNYSGGGILNGSSGALTINGGTISGNRTTKTTVTGGGIYNAGALTLNNGVISGNAAHLGGGVYNRDKYTFNMTGGVITNNTKTTNSTDAQGAGVYLADEVLAKFNISGDSKIVDNLMVMLIWSKSFIML